ncbi:LuxR C-terminal-related transcriptional regulator [Microbacterium paludicola]|uniref:LuxR C-terminal-related transcriptional regulator n=1 Tax=Microbacterium paludicola TaxID=300019 RepID=UPI0031D62444
MSVPPLAAQAFRALAEAAWADAVALADRNWDVMLHEHPTALRAIAEAVPPEMLLGRPHWQQLHLQLPYRSSPSIRRASLAKDPAWRRVAELTARSRSARLAGDVARAVECAFEARDEYRRAAAREEPPASAPRLMFEWALAFVVGGPVERSGWDTQPEAQLEETYSSAFIREDYEIAARAAAEMAWLNSFAGRADATAHWLERAAAVHRASGGVSSPARLAQSMRRSDALDFRGALAALVALSGDHLYDHRIIVAAAAVMYAVHLGPTEIERARSELARNCETSPPGLLATPVNAGALAYAESYRLLLDGRPARALKLLQAPAGARLPLYAEARRASALLQAGDLHGAEMSAMAAIEEGGAMPRFVIEARAALAVAQLRAGARDAARESFGRAVALADRHTLPVALGLIGSAEFDDLRGLVERSEDSPSLASLTEHHMRRPQPTVTLAALTPQERRVLEMIGSARSVAEAAARLEVSPNTVKSQLQAIYRKFGVSRRSELLSVAREQGLL